MLPPAPPRLSITTCWFQASESFAATIRATESMPPPAGNGTTRRTKRDGHACARAGRAISAGMSAVVADSFSTPRRLSMALAPRALFRLVRVNSGRLHAFLPDDRGGFRDGEEFHQRPCRVRLLRCRVQAGREHGDLLDVGRQRTDEVDALHRQYLADLLETDLGLAAGNHLADRLARLYAGDLRFDLIGNTHALE